MTRWGLVAAIGLSCGCKSQEPKPDESVSDGLMSCLEPTVWYKDVDVDGFGAIDSAHIGPACPRPVLHTNRGGDCDDRTSTVNPGATEVCDGLDNDCNGLTDDADAGVTDALPYYLDVDDDGYGAGPAVGSACAPPAGHVANDGDCNDDDPRVNPAVPELMDDGIDNDCDRLTDKTGALSGTWTELSGDSASPEDWECSSVWSITGQANQTVCPECDLTFWVEATFDAARSQLNAASCPQDDSAFGIALLTDVDGLYYLGLVSLEEGVYYYGPDGYYQTPDEYLLEAWPEVSVDWDGTTISFERGAIDAPVDDGGTTTYQTEWWGFEGVVD